MTAIEARIFRKSYQLSLVCSNSFHRSETISFQAGLYHFVSQYHIVIDFSFYLLGPCDCWHTVSYPVSYSLQSYHKDSISGEEECKLILCAWKSKLTHWKHEYISLLPCSVRKSIMFANCSNKILDCSTKKSNGTIGNFFQRSFIESLFTHDVLKKDEEKYVWSAYRRKQHRYFAKSSLRLTYDGQCTAINISHEWRELGLNFRTKNLEMMESTRHRENGSPRNRCKNENSWVYDAQGRKWMKTTLPNFSFMIFACLILPAIILEGMCFYICY